MTVEDIRAIAQILAGDLATGTPEEKRKVIGITYSLADYLVRTKPRFRRNDFYSAVGILP